MFLMLVGVQTLSAHPSASSLIQSHPNPEAASQSGVTLWDDAHK